MKKTDGYLQELSRKEGTNVMQNKRGEITTNTTDTEIKIESCDWTWS